jgi:CheY-like chemotaxis protein
LLVEDDADTRSAFELILQNLGHTVRTAADGQQALGELRAGPRPDLILLDLMLPVLDGWGFRRRQVEDPALAHIPVVVLSAVGEFAARADDLGDVGYLQKPADPEELSSAVERFTAARRPGVLVVADGPAAARSLGADLRPYGFAVWTAGGSSPAATIYRQQRDAIDLALLDVQTPGLDPSGTLRALREVSPAVRACFLWAPGAASSAEELQDLGGVVLASVPGHPKDLAEALWRVIRPG